MCIRDRFHGVRAAVAGALGTFPSSLQPEQRSRRNGRSSNETRKQFEIKRKKATRDGEEEEEEEKRRRKKKEEEEMANLLKELKGGELLLGGRKQQQQPANSLSLSLLPFTGMHYSTYSQQDSQIKRGKNGGKNSTKKTRRRRSNNDSCLLYTSDAADE